MKSRKEERLSLESPHPPIVPPLPSTTAISHLSRKHNSNHHQTQTMSLNPEASDTVLKASYTAPNAQTNWERQLPNNPPNPSTQERTTFLSALRQKITDLQADINVFLTQKMQEDNALAGAAVNDTKEEENYGEEVAEDDA
ncbi:hypothetical protein BT63DRAFT_270032 [Microthyrium microscopicum]|uniref:EKC/KEOPS complex subunit GON7 n=1 Tax=Microthyrium microscopicum TaxID=703497 RepID=A0A6A6U987_9PEZI|nr:hypothetical protein BT63DRAFT_270032 [Microthyrium microscopicum]